MEEERMNEVENEETVDKDTLDRKEDCVKEDDVQITQEQAQEQPEEEQQEEEASVQEEEASEQDEDGQPDEDGADAQEPGKKEGKSGFFKKKKDKRDEQIEDLNDRLKRQMAEFDNFRKRTEKEKSQMFDMGARTIIEKVLPVVDNFERGLAAVPEEQREDAFVSGMDKVYKQLMTELDGIGVKAIECTGKEFDPKFHNAVMQVESEELESGTVAQELQRGYMYKDTVVRHSMVSVVS